MQLTVRDAARLLNVPEREIHRWADAGEIPGYRVNDQYRFNRAELLEWATARRLEVSPDLLPRRAGGPPLPTLAEALRTGGIHYRLPGTDRASVLRAMVDAIDLPDRAERDALYDVLLARESTGATSLGNGVWVPHVRNPLVFPVTSCTVTLFFLERPIELGGPARDPARVVFWLVSPTIRAHMGMLARIAAALHDPGLLASLAREAPAAEILEEVRRVEDALDSAAREEA